MVNDEQVAALAEINNAILKYVRLCAVDTPPGDIFIGDALFIAQIIDFSDDATNNRGNSADNYFMEPTDSLLPRYRVAGLLDMAHRQLDATFDYNDCTCDD